MKETTTNTYKMTDRELMHEIYMNGLFIQNRLDTIVIMVSLLAVLVIGIAVALVSLLV